TSRPAAEGPAAGRASNRGSVRPRRDARAVRRALEPAALTARVPRHAAYSADGRELGMAPRSGSGDAPRLSDNRLDRAHAAREPGEAAGADARPPQFGAIRSSPGGRRTGCTAAR